MVLAGAGVGPGQVGIRMTSGSRLYLAILSTVFAGCRLCAVDIDDPVERADLVFGRPTSTPSSDDGVFPRAGRSASEQVTTGPASLPAARPGRRRVDHLHLRLHRHPKGVAVTTATRPPSSTPRPAFPPDDPLGPGDRVLAGLSVAFDASCEEMWLAWRHGAAWYQPPRPRTQRHGPGPWLVRRAITVGLDGAHPRCALWPPQALESVRLLIFGGEACRPNWPRACPPPTTTPTPDPWVWNTYGPTEATVVACAAARLDGTPPVRIGLPLDGWDLAVVDENGPRSAGARPGNS